MNVFVPCDTFEQCVRALDNKRLNKQIAECAQILRQLDIWPRGGWSTHPAVKAWVGYDIALFRYMEYAHIEHIRRGYNTHTERINILARFPEYEPGMPYSMPDWWHRVDIHESHRVNLNAKILGLPYGDYVWPVQ
jgi:hypothetical protein